jgi:hypothetical protein
MVATHILAIEFHGHSDVGKCSRYFFAEYIDRFFVGSWRFNLDPFQQQL